LSFPQLHFSRTPYAEVVGQFFILTAMYSLVVYLQDRRLRYCAMGIAALTAAFAARVDALLALPTLIFFVVLLALHQDWRGLLTGVAVIVVAVWFTQWTANWPYLGALGEILLAGQLRFLHQLDPRMILGLGSLLSVGLLVALRRHVPALCLPCSVRWGLSLAVILGIGYSLHIRPLRPEYVLMSGKLFPTYNEEVMAVAAQYLSPLFFWLSALGVMLVLWQRDIPWERVLFLLFIVSFGAAFFWKYTTARVYPVALRRLVPEVLPGLSLLSAYVLRSLGQHRPWRWAAVTMAGLVMVLLMSVAAPYWFYREANGTWGFVDRLAGCLPADAIVLFEPRHDGSIVGWFATPLWSFYQRQALLLNIDGLHESALRSAMCYWQSQDKPIYIVSQEDPSSWWPGEFEGRQEAEVIWNSSIIGQSRRFPPYIWRFAFTVSIYRWEGSLCTCSTS